MDNTLLISDKTICDTLAIAAYLDVPRVCLFRTFVSRNFRIAHNPGISRLSFRTRKINTTTGCCVRWMHYSSLCAGVPGICITGSTTTITESEFVRSSTCCACMRRKGKEIIRRFDITRWI